MHREDLPDAFHALAAMCKFMGVPKIDPAFHRKHYHAVEMTIAFIRVLVGNYPQLEAPFRKGLPLPIDEAAAALREVLPTIGLSEEKVAWLDGQMTEILKVLIPVVRDPDLPSWLSGSKWAIEGQFHKPH